MKLDNLVSDLVRNAPSGELKEVQDDLECILSDISAKPVIVKAIENYANENFGVFSSSYIASKFNKKENSLKYIDYIGKQLFNIDIENGKAIDFEEFEPQFAYPEYYDDLVTKLTQYGEDYYPAVYAFTAIPSLNSLDIIIIGQKLNKNNFYTGQWQSHYTLKDGSLNGHIKVGIHYYEDGNVRLNFLEHLTNVLNEESSGDIVNAIYQMENKIIFKIMEEFGELNQRFFKNLRRLLPVTRSKINWGKSIGNYKLGSAVVNKSF